MHGQDHCFELPAVPVQSTPVNLRDQANWLCRNLPPPRHILPTEHKERRGPGRAQLLQGAVSDRYSSSRPQRLTIDDPSTDSRNRDKGSCCADLPRSPREACARLQVYHRLLPTQKQPAATLSRREDPAGEANRGLKSPPLAYQPSTAPPPAENGRGCLQHPIQERAETQRSLGQIASTSGNKRLAAVTQRAGS